MTVGLNIETLFLALVVMNAIESAFPRNRLWALAYGLFFSVAVTVLWQ